MYLRDVRRWETLSGKVGGRGGDNGSRGREAAQEVYEEPRGSCVGALAQVSISFPTPSLGNVIAGGSKDIGVGTGIGCGIGIGL
jgi:hypothetical protein